MIFDLPEDLAIGRRAVLGLSACNMLDDFKWHHRLKKWVMRVQIACGDHPSADGFIGPVTNWHVVVSPSYPLGEVKIYPDKEGGVAVTFHHQNYNSVSNALSWRNGDICVNTSLATLWRKEFTQEPSDAAGKLKWHIGRAIEWINAAIRGELTSPGEPFELPPLPNPGSNCIAFNEDATSFDTWTGASATSGMFKVKHVALNDGFVVIDEFNVGDRQIKYDWGTQFEGASARDWEGIWIKLNELPVLKPWQVPKTWEELFAVGNAQGVDIQSQLVGQYGRSLYGAMKYVALGFPIPFRYGDAPKRMHWFATIIPPLPRINGFNGKGAPLMTHGAKILFAANKGIDWVSSQNWNREQISTRGRVKRSLQDSNIVIVGAGAVGSLFTETLLRLGCGHMTIVDNDWVEMGNLARHVLTMEAVRKSKSEELAKRLNAIFPYASVQFRHLSIGEVIEKEDVVLQHADLVIDATGDDEAMHILSGWLSGTDKIFISLSIGLMAERLFCFVSRNCMESSISNVFFEKIGPWLLKERQENEHLELPREGWGCWHPIFPARFDDISMLLGAAMKPMEALIDMERVSTLIVIEKEYDAAKSFSGLRIIRE